MKVLVIGGGISAERDISLRSSKEIFEVAKSLKQYETDYFDWNGEDVWLKENARKYGVVLPILHGLGGEDGQIQSILENLNVAYLGSDSAVSKTCFNKEAALAALSSHGVMTPAGGLVTLEQYKAHGLFRKPHVLKPYNGGSSLDTFIYPKVGERDIQKVEDAFIRHKSLLLEEYIDGIELTVPILKGKVLPVIEISPPENQTFDYENKYNGLTKHLIPPMSVDVKVQKDAQELGKKVHNILGCRHLSRTDIIARNGQLYVLEINTLPGMTAQSLFPDAAAVAGLNFTALVEYFIELAQSKV